MTHDFCFLHLVELGFHNCIIFSVLVRSVSWAGHVRPEFADDYTFSVTGDDGFRLEVDGILVIDNWNGVTGSSTKTGSFVFPKAERLYTIKLDYRDNTGMKSSIFYLSSMLVIKICSF